MNESLEHDIDPRFAQEGTNMPIRGAAVRQLELSFVPPPVQGGKSKFEVKFISVDEAKPFVSRWHYTNKIGAGAKIFIGGYVDGELYAVACYSHSNGDFGGSGARLLARITGLPVTEDNILYLQRLCRTGDKNEKGQIPLTQFLSKCHRLLRKDQGIRFIASFSDPMYNAFKSSAGTRASERGETTEYTSGGIYKAANFQYLGKTSAVYHCINSIGEIVHRRVAYKLKERRNAKTYGPKELLPGKKWPEGAMTIAEARKELGLKTIRTEPKDRWFLDLNPGRRPKEN